MKLVERDEFVLAAMLIVLGLALMAGSRIIGSQTFHYRKTLNPAHKASQSEHSKSIVIVGFAVFAMGIAVIVKLLLES